MTLAEIHAYLDVLYKEGKFPEMERQEAKLFICCSDGDCEVKMGETMVGIQPAQTLEASQGASGEGPSGEGLASLPANW